MANKAKKSKVLDTKTVDNVCTGDPEMFPSGAFIYSQVEDSCSIVVPDGLLYSMSMGRRWVWPNRL